MTTVDILSTDPDLSRYRGAWEALYSVTSTEPSTSFEWADAMTRTHLRPADRFILLGLSDGGEALAFIPLVARLEAVCGRTVTVLSPLTEQYNTHSDILARRLDSVAAAALFAALFALDIRWDVFRMPRLLQGHPLLGHCSSLFERRPAGRIRGGEPSYFLPLPPTFEAYLAQRSAKFRNHLHRSRRKVAALGRARIAGMREVGGFDAAYELLLRVERRSWKHGHGTAISAVPHQVEFYREMGAGAAALDRLHLHLVLIDDEPVAYNLGYLRNRCYYYLKTSFDERWKGLGVATVLRAALIEELIASGVEAVDFPAEPYEWERQWTGTLRWHQVLTVYRPTLNGRVLAWADRLRFRRGEAGVVEHADARALQPAGGMGAARP